MPVRRRKSKRRADIDSDEWAYLLDEPEPADANPFTYMGLDHERSERAPALWREYGEAATAKYVSKHPGRRPRMWWRYSAPEPRRQVGGATKLPHESGLEYGMRVYYDPFGKVADDPPIYESEVAYMERLGLLLPGERERL